MKAAWYDKQGPAHEVLTVGELLDAIPQPGEVRIRIAASGVNPGDTKKRSDVFGVGMPYPRVVPHSDGAGVVDMVASNVSQEWLGKRVWCFGAQSYRPFGTAAEFTTVPVENVALLPTQTSFEVGACLGIPGITAHRAVHVAGPVSGKTVLVQGAGGSVGSCAVQLARLAGAHVIGTVRTPAEEVTAHKAGAHDVVFSDADIITKVKAVAPGGVDHVVEVAFAANIDRDVELLKQGGTLAAYATNDPRPKIPFWPMGFNNIQINLLGSDDFSPSAKSAAAADLNRALEAGWTGFEIGARLALDRIADAHDLVDHPRGTGRIVVVFA